MASRLKLEIIYYMMVTEVLDPKSIPGKNGGPSMNVFKVIFSDRHGEQFLGEYVTPEPFQSHFIKGIPQRFKVLEVQQWGDIILPLPESTQTAEKAIRSDKIGAIAGTTYSASILIAKDLFINANGAVDMTDDKWDELFAYSDRIENYLIDKYTKKILGE